MSGFVITTVGFLSELFLFSSGGCCEGGLLLYYKDYCIILAHLYSTQISMLPPLHMLENVNELNFIEIVNGLEL